MTKRIIPIVRFISKKYEVSLEEALELAKCILLDKDTEELPVDVICKTSLSGAITIYGIENYEEFNQFDADWKFDFCPHLNYLKRKILNK